MVGGGKLTPNIGGRWEPDTAATHPSLTTNIITNNVVTLVCRTSGTCLARRVDAACRTSRPWCQDCDVSSVAGISACRDYRKFDGIERCDSAHTAKGSYLTMHQFASDLYKCGI